MGSDLRPLYDLDAAKTASIPVYTHGRQHFDSGGSGINSRQWASLTTPTTWASGDFVIVHRDAFLFAHGFMETPEQRLHTDSIFLYSLAATGLQEVELGPPFFVLFHQPHDRTRLQRADGRELPVAAAYSKLWEMTKALVLEFGMAPLGWRHDFGLWAYTLGEQTLKAH